MIDGELAKTLLRDVARCADSREMVDALAAALTARLEKQPSPCAATSAVAMALALKGMISVADLARAARVSARQLERQFDARVGISPKAFLRIVRFQEVLRATRSGVDTGWASLALEHGFYDQAHFIKDFKTFVGRTPGEWKIDDDSLAAIFSAVRRPRAAGVGFFQSARPASA